ncbi:MAG: carbohydrate kinase family protein [Acidimicrobiia bacterium]|nr:carbohydrate kinase family protein [Acidimicrobiia bacterium]
MHDVYAHGIIARSTLCTLEGDFPLRAGYAEIANVAEVGHTIGGEAAGGAYVLARLGIATKLDGSWLKADEASGRIVSALSEAGVDSSRISLTDDCETLREFVFSDGDTRTVFGNYGRVLRGDRTWNPPSGDDIRASRIVCLDPFFGEESAQAAEICVEAGVPYVTIDVILGTEIGRHAEVLIVSEEFLSRSLGPVDPHEALAVYTRESAGLVILTNGASSVLFGTRGSKPATFDPFPVEVVDTTGAGDALRAGVIYGMLKGLTGTALIRTGCAVAGMVCERMPGFINSPTEAELLAFLDSH